MILIIGGAFQGKTAFLQRQFSLSAEQITDGESCSLTEFATRPALNRLHRLVYRMLRQGTSPETVEEALYKELNQGSCTYVLSDEIGCGVVPLEKFDRSWRECVGRLTCRLAEQAETVVWVECGLPRLLKGTIPKGAVE